MVPTIMLHRDAIHVLVPGDDDIVLAADDLAGLQATLQAVASSHTVSGRVIVAPTSGVPYERLIAALDVARGPGFPHIVVAGGVD